MLEGAEGNSIHLSVPAGRGRQTKNHGCGNRALFNLLVAGALIPPFHTYQLHLQHFCGVRNVPKLSTITK